MTRRTTTQPNAATPAVRNLTPAMEDYLKAIYLLDHQGTAVTTQALARSMNVSPPSVTEMVRRLADQGLVTHARYKPVVLTGAGEGIGLDLIERYRLVVGFLVANLGYPEDAVEQEADSLEHAVSGRLRDCLAESVSQECVLRLGDDNPSDCNPV